MKKKRSGKNKAFKSKALEALEKAPEFEELVKLLNDVVDKSKLEEALDYVSTCKKT